jgi:serine/threonine-protein kinase
VGDPSATPPDLPSTRVDVDPPDVAAVSLTGAATAAARGVIHSVAERQDLAHAAAFYRRARIPGYLGWLIWAPFDFVLDRTMYPDTLGRSLAIRAVTFVLLVLTLEGIIRAKSYRAMTLWLLALAVLVNGGIAAVGTRLGGIHSPYNPGGLVILAVLGFSPLPWQRILPVAAASTLAYPVVLVGYALRDPAQHAAMHAPGALVPLGVNTVLGVLVAGLACIGASLAWSLRQQVFESRSIGRYQLRRRLGAGGMGEVWAAWHKGLQREVAVKILRAPGDPVQAATRFEREVRAMTELTHPNTVRVFDFGVTDDGLSYYAMELLLGENLVELVAHDGPLAPARAVYLTAQAARALAEAHSRGLVHRDVKPENLFVTNAGGERDFVKVLDFGIVRREAEAEDAHLTKTGSIAGTPAYLAPEVVRGQTATARADVYALGGVLYFLLTGRHVFQGENVVALLLAQLNEPVPSPSAVRGSPVPADLEALVLRCLAKDPAERPADAFELAEALAACSVAGHWRPALATSPGSLKPDRNVLAVAPTVQVDLR